MVEDDRKIIDTYVIFESKVITDHIVGDQVEKSKMYTMHHKHKKWSTKNYFQDIDCREISGR